ncbi:Shikimate kinase I [hydrothermal vent metagenome]|uniref:Shikimate kinase I n=1 Tax=hydrothermal vent metagenome TaxID=652676 RepID=A0A3B1D8G2_9ZZZZ
MNRSIISDTGPLISLEKLNGGYSFIQQLYDKIIIPSKVLEEIGQNFPAQYLSHYNIEHLIEVREVSEISDISGLETLHEGEVQAISLAYQLKLPLLIEEYQGRRIAAQTNIKFSGIAKQIVIAYKQGFIDRSNAVEKLKEMLKFGRINKLIYDALIIKVEENINNNIVFIGFMGTGKSSTSKRLAEILGREVVSTDALIEKQEGCSIKEIFENKGEVYFRDVEKRVVQEVSDKEGIIVDCGGGVVLNKENMVILKKTGKVIHLSASPKVIYNRVKDKGHRPLLNVDNPQKAIANLLEQRKPLYAQADYSINTDGKNDDDVCGEVREILKL